MNQDTKRSQLFLFTLNYPYGTGETFIGNELAVLAERFSVVYVFPLNSFGTMRELPQNIKVVDWKKSYHYNGKTAFKKHFFTFWKIFLIEFLRASERKEIIKTFPEFRSSLLQNLERAECIKSFVDNSSKAVFYTYWFDDWATILGILKIKGIIKNYFSRAHGFDLYSERRENNFIPFQNFQLDTVEKVFVVSKAGVNYLCKKYPVKCSKIYLGYLGVFDNGLNPVNSKNVFTLISCSNLVPVKRVHLIIEILKKVKIKMRWIHFGSGSLKQELTEKSIELPANIEAVFMGQKSNVEILSFYKNTPVNMFINVSESEGIPVSIMEAISFGIPVVATNVGGVSEIVNAGTGILLDSDFEVEQVAEIINSHETHLINSEDFRHGIRNYWMNNFNAKTNYEKFYSEITADL